VRLYRTPKSFAAELGYGRSTVTKWLPAMREDGVAMGHGKLTRIDVERAKQWITEQTKHAPHVVTSCLPTRIRFSIACPHGMTRACNLRSTSHPSRHALASGSSSAIRARRATNSESVDGLVVARSTRKAGSSQWFLSSHSAILARASAICSGVGRVLMTASRQFLRPRRCTCRSTKRRTCRRSIRRFRRPVPPREELQP